MTTAKNFKMRLEESFTKTKKIVTEGKWEPCTVTVKSSNEGFLIPISISLPLVLAWFAKKKVEDLLKGENAANPFSSEKEGCF